jgi:hypothetical protein
MDTTYDVARRYAAISSRHCPSVCLGACLGEGLPSGRDVKMPKGIAHVSFVGGGIFLPARSAYDRQLLAEHVRNRVRAKGKVRVLVDDQRWMVHLRPSSNPADCSQCGRAANSACYLGAATGTPYCLACAFGDFAQPAQLQVMAERRMSS